jgi:hypothetical protein
VIVTFGSFVFGYESTRTRSTGGHNSDHS